MNNSLNPDAAASFGTPGHIGWVRNVLDENVANLREGFPLGERTRFAGTRMTLLDVLRRGGVIASHYPGLDWTPKALSPDAPVYVQGVLPADLWEDAIEVLAFEKVMGEAIVVGCKFGGEIEFVLATDAGGQLLLDALNYGSTPPRVVGRGSKQTVAAPSAPEPEAQPAREESPRLAESGYTDWFLAELNRHGVPMLDTPPDDWPDDPDLVPVPGFSATKFIAEAKAARAPVVLDRHDGTTIDEEDGKPGPPMLMAGFLHEGKVTYVVTCDEGGVEVRAEVAGITVEDQVALEELQERLYGKVRTFAHAVRVSSPDFLVHPEEAMREEWAARTPVLPTQAMLVEDAARYRSAIDAYYGRIGHSYDDRYTDFSSSGTPVPQRLRPMVDAIVGDPDYGHHLDPDGRDRIARRHAGHLSEDECEAVVGAAYYTFKYTIGKAIGFHALPWARHLAAHPDVRPEWRTADLERWVDNQLGTGADPRLVQEIIWEISRLLRRRASAARLLAHDLYQRIHPSVLDRVGFTSRREERHALLVDTLAELPEEIRRLAGDYIIDKERVERTKSRERRYATAGRALLAYGFTPAGTASTLKIGSSVLKRLLTSHPKDIKLKRDDPLWGLLQNR
ncbi:hypothetical protein [Nocardioides pacificus]